MFPNAPSEIKQTEDISELSGKLAFDSVDDKLMHTVLEGDKDKIDNAKMLEESINQGIGSFTPDLLYQNIVNNYSMAKKLYGETLIRILTGYDPRYIKKNIKIPEFQRQLKSEINKKINALKEDDLLDKDFSLTEKAIEFTSLVTMLQELDNFIPKGLYGEKQHKKNFHYGDKTEVKNFKKGDRYKDIDIRGTIKLAIRRGHNDISVDDLQVFRRKAKGKVSIIFALDASSSMKGEKLGTCKRAGITLAYNAIKNKDDVGLIAFGSEVKKELAPSLDFGRLLKEIMTVRANSQTDIKKTLDKATELFPEKNVTKHLILITDSEPTVGDSPKEETLSAVSTARSRGITISIVGIDLDKEGRDLARKIVELGEGRLYSIKDFNKIGSVILEDYYSI